MPPILDMEVAGPPDTLFDGLRDRCTATHDEGRRFRRRPGMRPESLLVERQRIGQIVHEDLRSRGRNRCHLDPPE